MTERLRLVAFTSGPLTPINRVFFERLAGDPLLDLAGIIVDEYRRTPKPIFERTARAIREDGFAWIAFKLDTKLRAIGKKLALRFADLAYGRAAAEESYPALTLRTGVPVYSVSDIQSADSVALIRSLAPDLGIIVGTRILSESVIAIPAYGTLNIHKRKVPDYRGGGPVGYWELLAGESSIGLTIHYAAAEVDAGPVLAEASFPIEECDTLESLQLKADLRGARLFHETLRRFAAGQRNGASQDRSRGRTYRAPSHFKVWRLQRQLQRRATAAMPSLRARPPLLVKVRLFVQYIALLPHLLAVARRLVREQRAPITVLFYHLVADQPLNHMCLPLPVFARQMEFLRRHYALMSLDEAVARLRSGTNAQIGAAITFDDGYAANTWAIEYLRYFGIPAAFFVSIGHVRDGSAFEHDSRKGFEQARPMSIDAVRRLNEDGFVIGSHGIHHEDFGALDSEAAERVLQESRDLIQEVCGTTPRHFSFPKGQRGTNITEETFALALKHYLYVYSAYSGYCFPQPGRRHFLRTANPHDVREMAMLMSGYTGFRTCLKGNAWGLQTEKLDPCSKASDGQAPAFRTV